MSLLTCLVSRAERQRRVQLADDRHVERGGRSAVVRAQRTTRNATVAPAAGPADASDAGRGGPSAHAQGPADGREHRQNGGPGE